MGARNKSNSTFGKPPLPTRKYSNRKSSLEGLSYDQRYY